MEKKIKLLLTVAHIRCYLKQQWSATPQNKTLRQFPIDIMASHPHIMVLSRDFPLLFACGNLLGEKAVGCDNNIISGKPA